MINGDAKEFVEGLYYGDERFFRYNRNKYFIQGYFENKKPLLELYILEPIDDDFRWQAISKNNNYPVEEFENAKIFEGKSFWEIEKDIEWIDC